MTKLHFLLDGDGVLWRGAALVPGAAEFLEFLRAQGHTYCLVTNNSALRREDTAKRVAGMGLPFKPEQIFNTNYLAACYLNKHHAGASVLVIGSDMLVEALKSHGLRPYTAKDLLPADIGGSLTIKPFMRESLALEPDIVLVGLDTGVDYSSIALACRLLHDGAKFIATNRDYTYPLEHGYLLPGNGAWVELLEKVTGVAPVNLGKPETHLVELVEREMGVERAQMVMVGDRFETDIEMAQRAGIRSVLVLTGVTSEIPKCWPEDYQPTFVVRDLPELQERFERFFNGG